MPTFLGKHPPATPSPKPGSRFWTVFVGLSLLSGSASGLQAQSTFGVPIQLPTQSFFGVDTTVSVPDGGSISLGGNYGSAWSSTRRGGFGRPFVNRASGGTAFAHNASVHVKIISLAEMEAELLSQLPAGQTLDDYARPAPPRLLLGETVPPPAAQLHPASTEQPQPATPSVTQPAYSRSARSAVPPAQAGSSPARAESPAAGLVDPNGSRPVQDKADFMSRHIGRKKK